LDFLIIGCPDIFRPIISCEKPPLILHSQTINTKIIHDWTTVKSGADNSPTKSDTKSVTKVTLNLKEVVVGIMIGNDLWLKVLWLQKISALIKVITH